MSVDRSQPLFLSDGTPVEFVKVTSRGRYQVRLPASHAFGRDDQLRIFDPRTGAHYKNGTSLTLTNTAPSSTSTSTPTGGRVDPNAPLYLTDGTAVTLSKVTRRGRIQVRLPDSHPNAAGQENGWLFEADTGARYKSRDPQLVLTNTAPTSGTVSAAPVAAAAAKYVLSVDSSIISDEFDTFDEAESAAFDELHGDNRTVTILAITTAVAGVVSLSTTRA